MVALLITDSSLGKRIAHYRKDRKLSQAELGAIIGIYNNYISRIENGRIVPSILTLARLAAAFGVTIDELVGKS